MALKMPTAHPRPAPVQREQRAKQMAARKTEMKHRKPGLLESLNMLKKHRALEKQKEQTMAAVERQQQGILAPPLPPTNPEQRAEEATIRRELQADVTGALVRCMRTAAGRWCGDEQAARIEGSPALRILIGRSVGFVDLLPDVAKAGVIASAKLL